MFMQDYDFYKNKFDRELSRRNDLDNAITNPILGITIIVGLTSYILTNHNFDCWNNLDYFIMLILIVTSLATITALVCIFISINNLIIGHGYKNFGTLREYRKYQLEIETHNKSIEEENMKIDFEREIVEKIIDLADNNTVINDKRGLYLYFSKRFIIVAFFLAIINIIIVTINNFINHG